MTHNLTELDWQIIREAIDYQILYTNDDCKDSPDVTVRNNYYNMRKRYKVTPSYFLNLLKKLEKHEHK